MHSNYISNFTYNWKVFHALCKVSDKSKLDLIGGTFNVGTERLVNDLKGADISVSALVGMASIDDDAIEADLLIAIDDGVTKLAIVHLSSLVDVVFVSVICAC